MIRISFISSGSTASQTPVMASICYNLVKNWVNKSGREPDFPVACIYDFSNMYTTLQYFATDKIMMRMDELTSILELLKDTDMDWSKCSFPSKYVHKKTNESLFFMIPIFPRGITSHLTKSDLIDLIKFFYNVEESIEKTNCNYVIYDLPIIDTMGKNYPLVPALLTSNYVIGIVDCNKPNYTALETEITTLTSYIEKINALATPKVKLNGLIFNQVNEKVQSEQWLEKIITNLKVPIIGTIKEDAHFITISSQYEIPTEEKHFKGLKSYSDFENIVKSLEKQLENPDELRNVEKSQLKVLEEKIFAVL